MKKVVVRNIPPLPAEGFVRLPTVLQVIPLGRTSWWNGVKSGRYPPAHKIGARATGWKVEDIRALIERLGSGEAA